MHVVHADNPFNWTPSISISDNLDEPDGNGFCIDITGFGSSLDCSTRLQAHSCKSQGSDTQFMYHEETKTIRSVYYNADCTAASSSGGGNGCIYAMSLEVGGNLGITECDNDELIGSDIATFDITENNQIQLTMASTATGMLLCLAVDEELRQANSFWARDLHLVDCSNDGNTDAKYTTWTIKAADGSIVEATTVTGAAEAGTTTAPANESDNDETPSSSANKDVTDNIDNENDMESPDEDSILSSHGSSSSPSSPFLLTGPNFYVLLTLLFVGLAGTMLW